MLESHSSYGYCLVCIAEHNYVSIFVTSFLAVIIFSGKDRFFSSLIKCKVESLYPHRFPSGPNLGSSRLNSNKCVASDSSVGSL